MNFIEIFKEEGLYTFNETNDGVAFRVRPSITDQELEMRIVQYMKPEQQEDRVNELREYALNNLLVTKDFVKVDSVKTLFGFERIDFF